jgi:hypothetical protein
MIALKELVERRKQEMSEGDTPSEPSAIVTLL